MTAAKSLCTLGTLVLMDDSSATQSHHLQDHLPSAPQVGAVWTGDLLGRKVSGGLVTMTQWAFVHDGGSQFLQQRVRGSRCGIGLPRSLLLYRESQKLLMYLIDVFFYTCTSINSWLLFLCIMVYCFSVVLTYKSHGKTRLHCHGINKPELAITFMILLCHVDIGIRSETPLHCISPGNIGMGKPGSFVYKCHAV